MREEKGATMAATPCLLLVARAIHDTGRCFSIMGLAKWPEIRMYSLFTLVEIQYKYEIKNYCYLCQELLNKSNKVYALYAFYATFQFSLNPTHSVTPVACLDLGPIYKTGRLSLNET